MAPRSNKTNVYITDAVESSEKFCLLVRVLKTLGHRLDVLLLKFILMRLRPGEDEDEDDEGDGSMASIPQVAK